MTREDAFYFLNLLLLGIPDGYEEWLHRCSAEEEPMSDTVLELLWCFSDMNKTISLLNRYYEEGPLNEAAVAEKLRLFFKEAYHSNRMSKTEITDCMYHAALNAGTPTGLNMDIWGGMYCLEESLHMVREGIISWEDFDVSFFDCLNSSIPANANQTSERQSKPESRDIPTKSTSIPQKQTLLDRIKRLFGK